MKKTVLLALSIVVGVVLISIAAEPATEKPKPDDTIRELRTQITELRTEVNTLRQRTQSLESTVDELKHSHVPTPLNLQPGSGAPSPSNLPSPKSSRPPTIWGQGEVNGWTYYVV